MSNRPPSKIVFVGNIPYGLSEEQISDIFSSAGRVVSFRLVYDRDNGKPKGFGFAEYPDSDSAASAVRNLNDYEVMGRKLRVDFSNEGGDEMGQGGSFTAGGGGGGGGSSGAATGGGGGGGGGSGGSGSDLLPPLPPGRDIPPGASAADEISRVLRTLPPTQLLDILAQMKTLAAAEPQRATELLAQAPQLAYAVFQALLLMDLVSPEAVQAVAGSAAAGAGAAIAVHPASSDAYVPPPAVPAGALVGAGAGAAAGAGGYGYGADASAAAAAASGQNPDGLIKQVLELPQAVIDQLPPAERTQIMALRMQFGR